MSTVVFSLLSPPLIGFLACRVSCVLEAPHCSVFPSDGKSIDSGSRNDYGLVTFPTRYGACCCDSLMEEAAERQYD